jgi:hypothetical protein
LIGPSFTLPCQFPGFQQIVDCYSVPEIIFCGDFSFCTSHCSEPVWRNQYRDCGKDLTVWGSNLGRGERFFCCPKRPYMFLGPLCLILGGSLGSLPDMNLTTHPHLVPRLRIKWISISTPPTRLRGMDRDDLLYIFLQVRILKVSKQNSRVRLLWSMEELQFSGISLQSHMVLSLRKVADSPCGLSICNGGTDFDSI